MAYSTRCKLASVAAAVLVGIAIILAVVLTMNNGGSADSTEPWVSQNRLPSTVVPSRYDIRLHPNLDAGTFTGTVEAEIELQEDRTWFVIHAKWLDVSSVSLQNSAGSVSLKAPVEVPKNEWWVIQPSSGSIPRGTYKFTVEFSGSLTRGIVGFYRSTHTNAEGQTRYIATTKFEPTYARLAFPCFDEPAMKASYKVRLVKPASQEYIALSNSDVLGQVTDTATNLTTVEFTETVKMSSYLAAFIVCDFEKDQENKTMSSGKPVNIYARHEQIDNTKEALNVAYYAVNFYADYFKIPYPMPKVDLIAIPDFVSGAMENWGLITFRETSVLFDPVENSKGNQEAISETVAHELAHMWFGNLVTMKWWTDLWLNEGFATFMAQKSLSHMHPDWDYNNQFIVDTMLSILKLDSELSSHPVLQEVSSPDQITEIFDTISYDKGSSVIVMLEAFMGEDKFAKGLHTYLNTHQYRNAETADLWRSLQDYAPPNVDVAKVMDTWTRQMGFPVVTVTTTGPGKYVLSQKRFLSNPEATYDPSTSKYGYKWEIPIFIATSVSKSYELYWLDSTQEKLDITVESSVQWIKINHHQTSYFRTNYDDAGWSALIGALTQDATQIDAIDRAGLISDAFSLADAQQITYGRALDLTKYLVNEKELVPWDAAGTAIATLLQRLPQSEPLKKYAISLLKPIVSSLTWSAGASDGHLTRRLRTLVLELVCSLDDAQALSQANSLFSSWLNGGPKPDPDIRSVVYRYGLGASDNVDQWNNLFETKFKKETNTQERAKLMAALAATPNVESLKKYLDIAKDESIIRSQDYFTVLGYIANNPKGEQLVWDFYRDQYDYLLKRFTLNDRTFGRFIVRVTGKFDTETRLTELKSFFEQHPDAGAGTAARKQALEGVENRIKWLATHKKAVEDWLGQNA
ncbi:glutamyl aminopeptidase-like isoform X2 [Thrips palmi]|uniref:Aminopeptidase n=1 Tax=Thrips palmi TaxID=161013 RepID=A0A6P9AHG9_THRPL|nr:glutamyl aminopeptidase-like isoform X2 [Thrips palmi]